MIVTIEGDDCMWWEGQFTQITKVPEFDTYNDHRMAMAFAPISLFVPGIVIRDAEVVSKSYPQYWQHLANAGFMIAYADEQSKPTVQE
jgi:3-phosphoshikimate 1-carboxyvinyltransferase